MEESSSREDFESELRDELLYNRVNRISLINHMKDNKEFQNPNIIQQTIDYFHIDGNGTQFDPVTEIRYWLLVECLWSATEMIESLFLYY